ncbi:DUF167 domain-containing protein [archaeon]|jgi:uncharacterized protein YggU (UPF0235/DUF167 family)|nr:DUF167 domain-containing protein [archaeon]
MKIKVKLHPNSSQEKIKALHSRAYSEKYSSKIFTGGNDSFEVWIKEKPIDGLANKYLEKFVKKELGKDFKLVAGFNSRNKILEFLG